MQEINSEKSYDDEINKLRKDIEDVKDKIYAARNEMLALYDSNNITQINPSKTMSDQNNILDDTFDISALKCCFYQTFMVAKSENKSSDLTIAYPLENDELYGLNLVKTNNKLYNIKSFQLPHSISPEEFLNTTENINILEIPDVLNSVYKCICAYVNRRDQISKLEAFDDKDDSLKISSSPCHRYIKLNFRITTRKSIKDASVTLIYPELGARPNEVYLTSKLLTVKQKVFLSKQCDVFKTLNLTEAYDSLFT